MRRSGNTNKIYWRTILHIMSYLEIESLQDPVFDLYQGNNRTLKRTPLYHQSTKDSSQSITLFQLEGWSAESYLATGNFLFVLRRGLSPPHSWIHPLAIWGRDTGDGKTSGRPSLLIFLTNKYHFERENQILRFNDFWSKGGTHQLGSSELLAPHICWSKGFFQTNIWKRKT